MTDAENAQRTHTVIFNALLKVNRDRLEAFKATLESTVTQAAELLDIQKLRGLTEPEKTMLAHAREWLNSARLPDDISLASVLGREKA